MSTQLYGHIQAVCEHFQKRNQDNSYIFEISPAKMLAKSVFDYCLHAQYFNEYLSHIAELMCWDSIRSGEQTSYYLQDMILTISNKQSCYISKCLQNKYYVHSDLMMKTDNTTLSTDNILNNAFAHLNNPSSHSSVEEAKNDPSKISLKSNLRLRVLRNIPISSHKFPPHDKYHYIERCAYRTYTNKDVTINFEILRPAECQKKFEELLLPKPESKFVIKIWIHNPSAIDKYLKYMTENGQYKEIVSDETD